MATVSSVHHTEYSRLSGAEMFIEDTALFAYVVTILHLSLLSVHE